jgi:hypothetical protein
MPVGCPGKSGIFLEFIDKENKKYVVSFDFVHLF